MYDKRLYVNYLLKFTEEDAPYGDITSNALIPKECHVKAIIISKSNGILAGVFEAEALMEYFGISYNTIKRDGDEITKGDIIMSLEGNARDILLIERTVLNIMGRMSGIATTVRRILNRVRSVNSKIRIAGTRKSLLKPLDKRAIFVGGGEPHRFSLSDAFLIKDNHLKIVPIKDAIKRARECSVYKIIEVEVENLRDAIEAAKAGADIIMLDNMTPDEIMNITKELRRLGLRDSVLIEVSGGITEENVESYAKLDVDIISLGSLTHSTKSLDFSLEIVEVKN
ncbi:MAG TPA: carboxylating.nicotinate-nucleotide diphosphorylase [Euryarchaeota archaeon]|nr:carboxylating.nicotinate-nucleotide diphosphorylase [Euryarchaeota archaeon]